MPVSVVAITAEDAQVRGVTGTQSLTASVPGLVITSPANVGNPYLRGVGSALFDPSAEQAVAMYIDGVYISAPQTNIFSFNNIQQVEVLRGPQGTLFGRNATGGVIQITTRRPSADPHADLSVGYGNYDTVTASAYVTGGLAKNLTADFGALYENQGKGFGRNLTLGVDQYHQARGNYSLRSKILFEPTAETSFTLAGDYAHSVSTNAYQKPQGAISPIDGSTYPGKYNSLNDYYNRNRVNTGGVSFRIDQELGAIKLMNLVSYRKTTVQYDLDNDVTSRRVANVQLNPTAHNFSEEIQLSGPNTGKIKWIVGAYYFNSVGQYQSVIINGNRSSEDQQHAISYAGFGQVTAELLPKTELTLGLRYTTEDQTFTQTYAVSQQLKQSFSKLTYRAALNHHFTDDISAYASYNRGFKSGGFNLRLPGNSFQPETLDAYEIGLKTELFNRRLRFNIDGFYYDDKNVQVLSSFLGGTITSNAAAAHIKGIEADFEAALTRSFRLSGGFSIQDGKYASYPNGIALTQNGVRLPPQDQRGNKTIVTPPFSGTVTAAYNVDLHDGGRLQPSITVVYNDGFFWQSDNRLVQPAYTMVNASLLWTSADKKFDARIWGKNLNNAEYYIARLGVTGLGDVQERGAPRTFGITLGLHI
ncbi:hypothetical protein ASG11_04490 [Sphingomonas sp. Leaf357]|nr:hypothetical protein ASG11_04490 [Sphingomonas sp. Leaf357]